MTAGSSGKGFVTTEHLVATVGKHLARFSIEYHHVMECWDEIKEKLRVIPESTPYTRTGILTRPEGIPTSDLIKSAVRNKEDEARLALYSTRNLIGSAPLSNRKGILIIAHQAQSTMEYIEMILELRPGTQIVYTPRHVHGNIDHADSERGFITSVRDKVGDKGRVAFCRYWSKVDPNRLRTTANSEATNTDDLVIYITHPQALVDELLEKIARVEKV